MNRKFTAMSYKNIRTLTQFDGRVAALKYIRKFHVANFTAAKNALSDIINNERWTMPEIQADINGVREKMRLRFV